MRIAHFGTFDVENYGDMLFPRILEHHLSGICEEIVHVSPVGGEPPWADCVASVGYEEFLRNSRGIDGVVIGGGQIVRASSTPLKEYNRGGVSPFITYPALWLGAAHVAAKEGVPLCWNAPGVDVTLPPVAGKFARWSASVTDYLAVRDEMSRRFLKETGVQREVDIVPDTAIEISRLWSTEELSEAYQKVFSERSEAAPAKSVVLHVNSRWAGEELSDLAARLDRICAHLEAKPILIAIGPVHGDGEVQRRLASEMKTEPCLVDSPHSLREVAACIAHSELYLGSSLHGIITSCSFGRPGILVAGGADPKYAGFLEHFGLSERQVESWKVAEQYTEKLAGNLEASRWNILEALDPTLAQHWDRLRSALTADRRTEKRAALEQLPEISRDSFGEIAPFEGVLAEQLTIQWNKVEQFRQRLSQQSATLRELRQRLAQESASLREERQKNRMLNRWLQDLAQGVSELQASQWWKAIWAAKAFRRRFGTIQPEAMEKIDEALRQFNDWRRKSGKQSSDDE